MAAGLGVKLTFGGRCGTDIDLSKVRRFNIRQTFNEDAEHLLK